MPAPLWVLRLPSLWVLILPSSSRTRIPIALVLMSSSALSHAFNDSTAASAASSSVKIDSTTCLSLMTVPVFVRCADSYPRRAQSPYELARSLHHRDRTFPPTRVVGRAEVPRAWTGSVLGRSREAHFAGQRTPLEGTADQSRFTDDRAALPGPGCAAAR